MIKLKILLPSKVFLEEAVKKVVAEAQNGSFCLLPRHVDFVAALVPGILTYTDAEDREVFLAVDEGVLVKCGLEVLVSIRNAVRGPNLGQLRKTAHEEFARMDDREKLARTAAARLEASLVRRFVELEHG